LDQNQEIIT